MIALVVNGISPASNRCGLYFFDAKRERIVKEERRLFLMGGIEERAEAILSELLLGPFSYRLEPLFLGDARLGPVLHRGNRLYVSIENVDPRNFAVSFRLVREAISKSLSSSVPGFGDLVLFIDGRQTSP